MKYRNIGTVLGFDLTDEDGRTICHIETMYRPAKEEGKFWVGIRLHKFMRHQGEMCEFYYDTGSQTIDADFQNVKSIIILLIEDLTKH